MKWKGRSQSDNVEDRRGLSPKMALGGGGGLLIILIMVVGRLLDLNPAVVQQVANVARQAQQAGQEAPVGAGIDDEYREFVRVVLHDTETVWTKLFEEQVQGGSYVPPKLVMFTGAVQSGCGGASADMGPFYCPADQKVYLDPTFFADLAQRHQSPGDFAQAYVIAHEIAHHVQRLIGFSNIVDEARQQGDERLSNQMSVRLELQADFLAGVWAHYAHKEYDIMEAGDMEEAIQAANQIGDDTLQRQATGRVNPDRYTHGTSAQRARWFKRGLTSGRLKDCEELFSVAYERL